MADKKISQLTVATTPLAGTEVVPVVQSGVTKKVPVADLTAGRAISATEATLTTGNLVIGTSGKGIDFSATANSSGTMSSELLADYEEGTWTATLTGSTANPTTPVTTTGVYTKVGRQVTVQARFYNVNTTGATGDAIITGLPYTTSADWFVGQCVQSNLSVNACTPMTYGSTTIMQMSNVIGGSNTPINAGTARYVFVELTYFV